MIKILGVVMLAASTVWAAPDATAVIWGGGATREAADEAKSAWEESASRWDFVALAPGFPQVVKSDTLEGLKPGFFVVLLGVCIGTPDKAVDVLDALEPAIYTRTVKWSKSNACPATATPKEYDDATYELSPVEHLTVNGAELTAFLVTSHQPQGSEWETLGWSVFAFLRKGKTLDTLVLKNADSDFAKVTSLMVDGATITFEEKYASPSCVMGSEFVEHERKWRLSVKAGKLHAPTPRSKELSSGPCGGGD